MTATRSGLLILLLLFLLLIVIIVLFILLLLRCESFDRERKHPMDTGNRPGCQHWVRLGICSVVMCC